MSLDEININNINHEINITCDEIFSNNLKIFQPVNGPRVNLDTILLADWVKYRSGKNNFLEAGCASGAISLILALRFKNINITGLDIQENLIDLAKLNAANNNLDSRVKFIAGDLRDKNLLRRENYDSVIINPPYESLTRGRTSKILSRSVARLELSCSPEDVAEMSSRVLKSKGRLFAIFTSERLAIFINSMLAHKLTPKRLRPVYPSINNNSGVFLVECIKDGGEGLNLLPPLIVRDESGNYTPEILRAYEL